MINDIEKFLTKFDFNKEEFNYDKLKFRLTLLTEEYKETQQAFINNDAEELVDGLIDIIVIAIGTLKLAGVDVDKAWLEVMRANMSKERGIKPGRESSGGFDVIKPNGWIGPNHSDNHGNLDGIFKS